MVRISLLLVIGGCALGYFGIREFIVGWGTSSQPVAVELTQLEAGESPANNHVQIGKHVALYHQAVYSYRQKKHETGPPKTTSTVEYCYYPIVSVNHPFITELDNMIRQHGGIQDIPKDVAVPHIKKVAVLVKTHRFPTVGSIPLSIDNEPSVQGLIVNQISSLGSEEEKILRDGMPDADLSNVLILEHDRQPASFLKWFGMTSGGGLLVAAGVGLFFARRRRY